MNVLYFMVAKNDRKIQGEQIDVKLRNKKLDNLSLSFSTNIRILR